MCIVQYWILHFAVDMHDAELYCRVLCIHCIYTPKYHQCHSCQVSRNDRDSPGIFAFVPVVSRLTQKADNVPDFSQTLSSRAHRWHILSQQKLISLVEAKKVAFGTVLSTEPVVDRFF